MAGSVLFAVAFGLFAWRDLASGAGTAAGFFVVPVLLLLTLPLLRLERGRGLAYDGAGILFTALAVRCLGAVARQYVIEDVYGGADSGVYDQYGREFAESFLRLDFDIDPGRSIPGTGFLRVLTGVVYVFVGSSEFAGFLAFSFFAFLGTYLFYRAFVIAVPDADHRRYALIIFFWPSIVFWPSSIGKEAWMLLCLGLAAWGLARLVNHERLGYTGLGAGVLGLYVLRPHVAILVVAAAAVAVVMGLLFSSGHSVKSFGFVSKVGAVVTITVLGALLAPRVADFLKVEDLGRSGITEALSLTEERTADGGSTFSAAAVDSILDYPSAFVTVMFRPFPNEASNFQGWMSAAEGVLLIVLLVISIRAIRRVPVDFVKRPYVAYATSFVVMFAYAFASIGNFGILARQRTQVLPLLLIFVALRQPSWGRRRVEGVEPEPDRPAEDTGPPRVNLVTTGIGPPRQS